jgi:hypothetical protein
MALTRAEINRRYRDRDPGRRKEQDRQYYLRRKVRLDKMKEIEELNEALEREDGCNDIYSGA